MKKRVIYLTAILVALMLAACGNKQNVAKKILQNTQLEKRSTEQVISSDVTESCEQNSPIALYVSILKGYIMNGKKDFTVAFVNLDGDNTKRHKF